MRTCMFSWRHKKNIHAFGLKKKKKVPQVVMGRVAKTLNRLTNVLILCLVCSHVDNCWVFPECPHLSY